MSSAAVNNSLEDRWSKAYNIYKVARNNLSLDMNNETLQKTFDNAVTLNINIYAKNVKTKEEETVYLNHIIKIEPAPEVRNEFFKVLACSSIFELITTLLTSVEYERQIADLTTKKG